MLRPIEVPGLKNCGYDYCHEVDKSMDKSVEEVLELPLLPGSKSDSESAALKAAVTLLTAADSMSQLDVKELPVPGGILPVDTEKGSTQRVHTLIIKNDGHGYLKAPMSDAERPLTARDVDLFKTYFVNLGKILKAIEPL